MLESHFHHHHHLHVNQEVVCYLGTKTNVLCDDFLAKVWRLHYIVLNVHYVSEKSVIFSFRDDSNNRCCDCVLWPPTFSVNDVFMSVHLWVNFVSMPRSELRFKCWSQSRNVFAMNNVKLLKAMTTPCSLQLNCTRMALTIPLGLHKLCFYLMFIAILFGFLLCLLWQSPWHVSLCAG